MRVAIYARISTGKQETENQLGDLREFAVRQGWTVVEEFVDVISGGTTKRPGFDRMLIAASQRKFDLLLFWKLDRLSRAGVLPTLKLLQQLDEWGVGWRSYMENYLDSCGMMRDTVISIMATIAQQEKIAISDRTKAGLRRAVRQGKTLGRPKVNLDVKAVRRMQSAGLSLRAIGAKVGCSHATIIAALKAA